MTTTAVALQLVTMIGCCTECKRPFRVELMLSGPGCRIQGPWPAYGLPGCDCRAGKRCPERPPLPAKVEGERHFAAIPGNPICGDPDCSGHEITTVIYRPLKAVHKPGAICGPGNCWGAKSTNCLCSCEGRNHGGMWAIK